MKHITFYLLLTAPHMGCKRFVENSNRFRTQETRQAKVVESGAAQSGSKLNEEGIFNSSSLSEKCNTAMDLETKTVKISFLPQEECSWNTAGNLERRQGHLQATKSQSQMIDLDRDSILCSLAIKTQAGESIHYDDFLFLTLDNFLLLSSNGSATNYLRMEDQVYRWDLGMLQGKPIHSFESSPYCISGSTACSVTGHDQAGQIEFGINADSLAPIAFAVFEKPKVPIKLHITGDNDDGDCSHSGLNLVIEIMQLKL